MIKNSLISIFFALVLSGCCWAQSAEGLVEQLYRHHLKSPSEQDTVSGQRALFTPGFLKVIDRDHELNKKAPGTGANFLTVGNGGWADYEVGKSWRTGDTTIVPLVLYCGLRSSAVRTDSKLRAEWPVDRVQVLLTDIGHGLQIYDLVFLAKPKAGPREARAAGSARKMLRKHTLLVERWLQKERK